MSLIIIYGSRTPVLRIGRLGGQYAKPRSSPTEKVGDQVIPSFRGDNVNGFNLSEREPDPERLLLAYFHSSATINYVRALLSAGFADLHSPQAWDLSHVRDSSQRKQYERVVEQLLDALAFLKTIGMDNGGKTGGSSLQDHPLPQTTEVHHRLETPSSFSSNSQAFRGNSGEGEALRTVEFFVSHEGLLLDYESMLTRPCSSSSLPPPNLPPLTTTPSIPLTNSNNKQDSNRVTQPSSLLPLVPSNLMDSGPEYYNLGAHFLWIGDRTRDLDGAHVEYFRGIRNPVGVKCGPSMTPEELPRILDILNPRREAGKIVLITRYGAKKVEYCLLYSN